MVVMPESASEQEHAARRVFVVGATGTIGRATVRALVRAGHKVTCYVRPDSDVSSMPDGVPMRRGAFGDSREVAADGFCGEAFDAVVSCLASRRGGVADAWNVEFAANRAVLQAAQAAGVQHFVLLSAICVQKPRLAFQHAKLAFEAELRESGMTWSIVRPTAYFKSLSGQVARVQRGKPFLLIGNGTDTACTPISDNDVADYLVSCLADPSRINRVLPVGGPGPALTPRAQGELLFRLLNRPPRFRSVPLRVFDGIVSVLGGLARVWPTLADTAEFARIGRYYATESMLVWDPVLGRYDAAATPQYGQDTLEAHYARMLRGEVGDERGAHAVL